MFGPSWLTLMFTPPTGANGQPLPHAFGWFVQDYNGERLVWQFGVSDNASSSMIIMVPRRGVTLIMLANSQGLARPFSLVGGGRDGLAVRAAVPLDFRAMRIRTTAWSPVVAMAGLLLASRPCARRRPADSPVHRRHLRRAGRASSRRETQLARQPGRSAPARCSSARSSASEVDVADVARILRVGQQARW